MSPLLPFLLWTGFFVPLYLRSPRSSDLPWLSSASWLLSLCPRFKFLGKGTRSGLEQVSSPAHIRCSLGWGSWPHLRGDLNVFNEGV